MRELCRPFPGRVSARRPGLGLVQLVAAGVAVLLATHGAPLELAIPTLASESNEQAIERISVDLDRGVFDAPLPAGAPFYVEGAAPDRVLSVAVRIVANASVLGAVAQAQPSESPFPVVVATVTESAKRFTVLLPHRLEAGGHYRFHFAFQSDAPSELTARVRLAVRRLFDERLRMVVGPEITLSDGRLLRANLAELVSSAAGDGRWQAAPGSLFDQADQTSAAVLTFLQEIGATISTQLSRQDLRETLSDAHQRFGNALRAAVASPALLAVVSATSNHADQDIRALSAAHEDGVSLAGVDEARLAAMTEYDIAADTGDGWDRTNVVAQIASFERLQRRISQLQRFIAATASVDAPARALVEPVVGRRALDEVLTSTSQSLAQSAGACTEIVVALTRLARVLSTRDGSLDRLADRVALAERYERFADGRTAPR